MHLNSSSYKPKAFRSYTALMQSLQNHILPASFLNQQSFFKHIVWLGIFPKGRVGTEEVIAELANCNSPCECVYVCCLWKKGLSEQRHKKLRRSAHALREMQKPTVERSWWEREGEGIVHTEWQHGLYYTQYLPCFIFVSQSSRNKLPATLKPTISLWKTSLTCWDDHPFMGKQHFCHFMQPTTADLSWENICKSVIYVISLVPSEKNNFTAYFSNCKWHDRYCFHYMM